MATNSAIEWTDVTWNPVAGCTPVSPGCLNCYAAAFAHRLGKIGQQSKYAGLTVLHNHSVQFNGQIKLDRSKLNDPLSLKKPRRIFVNSMSDLFHEDVPSEYVVEVFDVIRKCPQHIFQILTKRPERIAAAANAISDWPLANAWIGTSVEDRQRLGRIDHLRAVAAAVRFLSVEPLLEDLGPLNLSDIDWVIIGGESGARARSCAIEWIRSIVKQCRAAGVAVFVKQLGTKPTSLGPRFKRPAGRGKCDDPAHWPKDLRVRTYPSTL